MEPLDLSRQSGRPSIHITATNPDVVEGQSHTITCSISSISDITDITWIKTTATGYEIVNVVGVDGKFSGGTVSDPSLTISDIAKSDEGIYACIAKNQFGTTKSEDSVLTCKVQQFAQVEPVSGTSGMGYTKPSSTTFQQDQSVKKKTKKSNNENEGDVSTILQESDESDPQEMHAMLGRITVTVLPKMCQQILESIIPADNLYCSFQNKNDLKILLAEEERAILTTMLSNGYKQFTVQLCYKILRHEHWVSTPRQNWGNVPLHTDIHISDDIERIRLSRNKIVSMETKCLDKTTFLTLIDEFREIAKRVDLYLKKDGMFLLQIQPTESMTKAEIESTIEEIRRLTVIKDNPFPVHTINQGRTNYARLGLVVVDIFPNILREIMRSKIAPEDLNRQIRKQHKHNPSVFNKMTHEERVSLNTLTNKTYDNIDFITLYKLVRSFSLLDDPTRGWGKQPTNADVTISDDVERLRIARNKIVHRIKADIDLIEMSDYFSNIVNIIQRMDTYLGKLPDKGFAKEVLNFQTHCIDSEMEQKYYQALKDIEDIKEKFSVENVHFYYGKTFSNCIFKDVQNKAKSSVKQTIILVLEDINDDEKRRILNTLKTEINTSLVNIEFKQAFSGSLIIYIDILDSNVLSNKQELCHQIYHFLCRASQLTGFNMKTENEITVVLIKEEDDIEVEFLIESDNWETYDEEISLRSNTLCLELEVNREIFNTEQKMQSEFGLLVKSVLGSNGKSNVESVSAILQPGIAERPSIHITSTNTDVVEGQSHIIACYISSISDITDIAWIKTSATGDKIPIVVGEDGKFSGGTLSDPSLTINNIAKSDEGTYACIANHCFGTTSSEDSVLTCKGYWYSIVMSSSIQPFDWEHYLINCECLGYEPEETVGTNSLQLYKTLYTRYCKDKGFQFDPTRNLDSDVDIKKLSELLYRSLSSVLGCQSILQIRRNINILMDQIFNQMYSHLGCLFYHLGSRAEGFRIKSDSDHMNVLTDNVVVNNTSEISELSFAQLCKPVITMETQYTKPGYVRLILKTDKSKTCLNISSSCHNYDDKLYISSTKFRENMTSRSWNKEVHGPCTTTVFHGNDRVYDIVYCLSCTSQPSAVQNWVMRCSKEHKWPDSVVLEQCKSLGCQLAPVGSKESPHEHLEWRISFILMENTILQSLSHSQFMCYGLLKLYLKEVLGSFEEINDLVSSYFMKTVLLWEIQTNSQCNVGAGNLLQLFQNCLRRLHTWVKRENCPNFFIPENNMFENRIYGESKHTLQNILELLFTEKFYGLYRCQTIDLPYLIFRVMLHEKQSVVVTLDESMYVTDEDIETDTLDEINNTFMYLHISMAELDTLLKTLELILTKDSLTDLEKIALQAWISKVTVYITIHDFKDIIAPNVSPDIVLEKYNSCCNIFRTHDHKGSVAPLYLATLMYITGRYHSCLDVIIEYIKRLKEGNLLIVYVSVKLQLTELRLELESTLQIEIDGSEQAYLLIDPSLYVSMLSVLCHYHLGNVAQTEIEFQLLRKIRSDTRYMKDLCFQEISWQILGICAEIIGKYDEAYQSYVRAYNSRRFLLLDNAPLLRLLCLIYKLLQK